MNTIELGTFGPGGGKADKTGNDGAAAQRDSGSAKDVFRALLRHLSGGKERGGSGNGGAAPGDAAAGKTGRPTLVRPGMAQAAGGKAAAMPDATPEAPAAPVTTPLPDAADAAAVPAEPAATPLAAILSWPDVLTRPAAEPEAANDDDDSPRDEAVSLDAILRAVSSALTESSDAAPVAPDAPNSAADRPQTGAVAAAGAARTGTSGAADPVAALHAALKSDGPDLDLDVARPERATELPKLTVLTRETHFEPVQRLSPVQQIVTTIVDDLAAADTAEVPRTTATPEADAAPATARGPLRVLHIKLEPEDLGAVVLRMRLVGQSLELHLEASRAETARLLDKDRDALVRVLRASGYTPDVVTVQTAATPDSAQSQAGRSGSQDGATSSGGFQQPARDGRSGDGRPSAPPSSPRPELAHDDADASRAGGDVYV